MAGDQRQTRVLELAAEHETGKLRDYAKENFCLIFGSDTPTTNLYNPSITPVVPDIVITKNLTFPVYVTSCSALTSDLPRFSMALCVTHPLPTHRIALASGALTVPTSKPTWKN